MAYRLWSETMINGQLTEQVDNVVVTALINTDAYAEQFSSKDISPLTGEDFKSGAIRTITIGDATLTWGSNSLEITLPGFRQKISLPNPLRCSVGFIVDDDTQKAFFFLASKYSNRNTYQANGTKSSTDDAGKTVLYNWLYDSVQPSYQLTSLRYADGADKTLWLTKIPDNKIFEGNYATSFGTEEKWFTPEDRSNFRTLTYGPILTINTENVSGVIELVQGSPDYLRISYHSGDTTAVVNQNLDHDNYPVGVTPLYTYLSLYEDAEQNVATFAISGVHPESGFFVEDTYFVNLNASAKTFLGTIGAEYLYRLIHAVPAPVIEGDDPYPFEPEAGPDSGSGDGQLTSDPNALTELPPSIASDIGFLTLFNPTQSEVKELATYMWTDDLFDVANFKKLFADPMDCILGFMAYPFVVNRDGVGNLVVGNISTDIPIHLAASEFQDVPLGTQKIPAPLGSFLDYAPFTKLMVYLPFCGEHQLDIDRYSGKTVDLTYRVNLLTGACVAILRDTDNGSNATNILDMFHGNMAYNIPLTSTNFENAMGAVIGITAGVVGGVAGVAMGGALSGASIANVAQNVTNLKPTIETAGSMAASVGSVASLAPFFRYVEPRLADSKNKNTLLGTPSCVTRVLSGLKGYVEVTKVDLASDIATTNELEEIQSLLKGGVYLEDLPLPE